MTNQVYVEDLRENPSLTDEMTALLIRTVTQTLDYENVDVACFVSISIVDSDEIKALNSEHRGIDSVTDVLSFPVVNLLDGSPTDDAGDYYEGRLILGDVVLCADRAKEQAEDFGHSIEREMGYLTCHSVLHLIGYDHEDEAEREVMRAKEEAVMALMNLSR
ncbi:MAG: rRNA maturation RNase YbeY [Ruminococcaceae bacterium]|nr:rRNA maturation RNase YbeY [Oscillospiraceae bacterium]